MNKDSEPEKYLSSEMSKNDSNSEDDSNESDGSKEHDNKSKDKKETKRATFFENKEKQIKKEESKEGFFVGNQKEVEKSELEHEQKRLENKKSDYEKDTTEDGLTEAEAQEVVVAFIESRNDELANELQEVSEDSKEEVEVLADVAFLELIREKIEEGSEINDDVINEAFNETAEDLGIDLNDKFDFSENEDHLLTKTQTIKNEETEKNNIEEGLNQNHQSRPLNTPNNFNTPTPNAGNPNSSTPPSPPLPPQQNNYYYSQAPKNPNSQNVTSIPRQQNSSNKYTTVEYVERRRRGRDLLVGGIVGYIIGRRGGRKRTEKKLFPKIEKLEREVGELHDVITEKEERIRSLARRTAESEFKLKTFNDKISIERKTTAHTLMENRQKRVEIKMTLKRREELSEKESVKKLTKFTLPALEIFREKRHIDGSEESPKRKSFETMKEFELLEYAAPITIDGNSVVKMYEQKRISKKALLEIVKKYYRSGIGNHEQIYWREIKNDPEELENRRKSLEKLHSQKYSIKDSIIEDNKASNTSDEQMQKYFQRYTDGDQQTVQPNGLRSNQKSLKPWIAIVVIVAILTVGYLLINAN